MYGMNVYDRKDCERHSGLLVSTLDSGFKPWPGSLCCVFRLDNLLSQFNSPPRCINGYRRTNSVGKPCDGLGPIHGGVEKLLVTSCYRNQDNLWLDGPLGATQTLPCLFLIKGSLEPYGPHCWSLSQFP